uniref:Uncharacterized protein n=1 Tax=Panagrolaimus superbus TaxID=310955 RepID=A0A914YXV9_9BILA
MFHPIVFGSLVCSVLYSDTKKRNDYIQEIETSLDTFIQFQNDYFDSSLNQSFNLCHSSVILETIKEFQPEGKVKTTDYQTLGNKIIKDLSKHGSISELRHVVVSQNLDMNTKYFPSCPLGNCKVFCDNDKQICIFYSANQPSNSALVINTEFFTPANLNLIEKYIYEKSNEDYLDTIRQYLASKNLSLTNSDRFMSEIWIRQWSALGDCPLETTVTTSGNSENYPFLPYYWRNWGKLYDCENFRIYVFP